MTGKPPTIRRHERNWSQFPRPLASIFLPVFLSATCMQFAGCADIMGEKEKPIHERQDDALRDPFNYGPGEGKSAVPSVTGGGTSEFDENGFRRDVRRALNP